MKIRDLADVAPEVGAEQLLHLVGSCIPEGTTWKAKEAASEADAMLRMDPELRMAWGVRLSSEIVSVALFRMNAATQSLFAAYEPSVSAAEALGSEVLGVLRKKDADALMAHVSAAAGNVRKASELLAQIQSAEPLLLRRVGDQLVSACLGARIDSIRRSRGVRASAERARRRQQEQG